MAKHLSHRARLKPRPTVAASPYRTWTVQELIAANEVLQPYAIYKMIERRTVGRRGAEALESVTGIPREYWMWPGYFGVDPYDLISLADVGRRARKNNGGK